MLAVDALQYVLGAFVVGLVAGLVIRSLVEFVAKAIDQ